MYVCSLQIMTTRLHYLYILALRDSEYVYIYIYICYDGVIIPLMWSGFYIVYRSKRSSIFF